MRFEIFFFLLSLIYSLKMEMSMTQTSDSTSKVFCTGNAGKNLPSNRILVNMRVDTNNTDKLISYSENTNISNSIFSLLDNLGLNKSNYETTSFSVEPQYLYIFNRTTNLTDKIFNGYLTSNAVAIKTTNLSIAGKILDTIVIQGGIVSGINYDLTDGVLKKEKLGLISEGMNDCKSQINDVLGLIGYKISTFLNININDLDNSAPPFRNLRGVSKSFALASDAESAPSLFAGDVSVKIKINVVVKIEK